MLFCQSCSKYDDVFINSNGLSVFVFLISDNDLDDHTEYIIDDLIRGLKGCSAGSELFLYVDRQTDTPYLRHFVLLEFGQVRTRMIKAYQEQYSTSPSVFKDILKTMITESSSERYGLIYWSHGSGWLPANEAPEVFKALTKAIGVDGPYSMGVLDMADILSFTKAPYFLLFDACFMGSVEVVYALRNSADYIIASPAEMLGIGFPYHSMLPELIKGTRESLAASISAYMDFCYTDVYEEGMVSGIASLIDCNEMDGLAEIFKILVSNDHDSIDRKSIQTFDCYSPNLYFDLGNYAVVLSTDTILYFAFERQLERTIVRKVNTPSVFTQTGSRDSILLIRTYSGLSTYIPGTYLDGSYYKNEWYRYCHEAE